MTVSAHVRVCVACGRPFVPTLARQRRCLMHEHARRAEQPRRAGSGGAWETTRRRVYERAGGRCERCGHPIALTRAQASVDRPLMHAAHLVPFAHGGSDTPDNIEAVCQPCHDAETYAR